MSMEETSDTQATSTKQKPAAGPLPRVKSETTKSTASSSDPVLNQNPLKTSPVLGVRPRSLTFSFTNRYCSRRRRMSLGNRVGDNKTHSITHSTQLSFLDFIDLFKAFGLRCRKDLKDLFEQFAMTKTSADEAFHRKNIKFPPTNDGKLGC